jgi:hypothetical protein
VLIRLIQKLHDQLENNKNLSPPPQPFTSAIIRETVKALINYAEPNSRTLMDTDLIETLCTIIKNGTATGPRQPLGDDESTAESTNASVPVNDSQLLVNCVWLIQNMCGSGKFIIFTII